MHTLTPEQAYIAMYLYWQRRYKELNNSEDISDCLSVMQFLPDGSTADQSVWEVWMGFVNKVIDKDMNRFGPDVQIKLR